MAPLEIYWYPISPYARTAMLFARLNKIKHTEHVIDLFKGQQKSEEYRKINPVQKVPALKEGDFLLSESVAILQYLSTKSGVPEHWYPKDAKKRAKVNEYMQWQSGGPIAANNVFVHVVVGPQLLKQPFDEAKAKDTAAKLHEGLDFIENNFLSKNEWLAGSKISIADIYAFCGLFQQVAVGVEIGRNRPKLASWYERVKAQNTTVIDELHQPLLELCTSCTAKY